jgi:HprK-related kinase A
MRINCGQYQFDLETTDKNVQQAVQLVYGDAVESAEVADFKLRLTPGSMLRRLIKPQVSFYCDQHSPFKPLPLSQAYAVLEWGMNWCIAAHEYCHFLVHAAVLVKNGRAILFPALPGSGKSTLSAYLGLAGWTVYSDEMAMIDPQSLQVKPLFRPVCIKNNSIALVKGWHPDCVMTPVCRDTQKGDVAHVKVLNWQHYLELTPVPICAVVFPKYVAGSTLTIYQLTQLDAFAQLSRNAFNYNVLGAKGFELVNRLVRQAALFQVEYSDVTELDVFLTQELQR